MRTILTGFLALCLCIGPARAADLVRVPVGARDLAVTGGVVFDKRQLLRSQPTSIRKQDNDTRLLGLQRRFEELAGKTIEGECFSVTEQGG